LCKLALREILFTFFGFYGSGAQHQMGEIQIESMRRHIGTFGHEAHVAQRASFGDMGEVVRLQTFDILVRVVVDQIKQARKRIAQIETAPAAMADVEDAPHLEIEFFGVVEFVTPPIDRVASGRLETAFMGHGVTARVAKSE
jgi:hypothetical protein